MPCWRSAIRGALLGGARPCRRRVAAEVPDVVAIAVVVVLIGAGAAHLVSESWVMPETRHLLLIAGAAFF